LGHRKSLIALVIVGLAVVMLLTFVPYSLTLVKSAGQHAVATLRAELPGEQAPHLPSPSGPPPAAPPLDVSVWYVTRGEEPERHGVLIETLDGRLTLASHNADTAFNPASLVKLATSLAALRRFGKDHRFETRVYADGEIDKQQTLQGNLYLVGSDPTFGDVAASLIARTLRGRGIERVRDKILVSPGLSFNYNESAEDSAAHLARVMNLKQKETGVVAEPAGRLQFALASYPLREVLLYMNAHSSNFVAERLGEHFGGAAGLEKFLEEELKLPAEQVIIKRVSGRENNRLTPRGVLTVLRALHDEAARQGLRLEDIMPIACDDAGTLRRRFAGTPFEGAVIGKTGTLTSEVDGGMASLAGLINTEQTGPILFALLDQGNHISENRELEDQLLTELVAHHGVPLACLSEPRKLLPKSELKVVSSE